MTMFMTMTMTTTMTTSFSLVTPSQKSSDLRLRQRPTSTWTFPSATWASSTTLIAPLVYDSDRKLSFSLSYTHEFLSTQELMVSKLVDMSDK